MTGVPVRSCLLAVPHQGTVATGAMISIGSATLGKLAVRLAVRSSSAMTHNFNGLWCDALNLDPRPDFWAMHHADLEGPPGWLDRLVAELDRGVDVVSACVAIKDRRGLTSTTVIDPNTLRHRRITVAELAELPETFGVKDIPWAPEGAYLGINTGLWACGFRAGWAVPSPGQPPWIERVCFQILDRIEKNSEGQFVAMMVPDDWHFAMWCHDQGLEVRATRAIDVLHHGASGFPNAGQWGTCKADEWHRL